MKIANRKKKIQSSKIVKELIMYLALLCSGMVHLAELSIEEDEKPISLRTFQRYVKELEETGAVPPLVLEKGEYEGDYYYTFKNTDNKHEKIGYTRSSNPYLFVIKKSDILNSFSDEFLDNYQHFNTDHEDKHIAKLSRVCKMANRLCRITEKERNSMNSRELGDFLKKYYKEEVTNNFNIRTYQRDLDAVVIALNGVFNGPESKRYKEVLSMFQQGYQKTHKIGVL